MLELIQHNESEVTSPAGNSVVRYLVMMRVVMAMVSVQFPAMSVLSFCDCKVTTAPRRRSRGINTTFRVNSVNKDLFTRHSYVISSTNLPESEAPLIRYGGEQMRIEPLLSSSIATRCQRRRIHPSQTLLLLMINSHINKSTSK